jgi:two-component system, chemotaxis family, chemotaxis protein CheY
MLRVLVVDDSTTIREKLCAYLRELGHEVVGEAGDGFEAIDLYQATRPDCVTLDIVMPQMDGLNALEEIRRMDPKAKVIMLSSAATESNRKRTKELGAFHFLAKPVHPDELQAVLGEIEKRLIAERAA